MESTRRFITCSVIIYTLLITALISTACVEPNTENTNSNTAQANTNSNSNQAKDDVSELLLIIRVPEVPDEVVWREETLGKAADNRVPGPADRKLIAVMKYGNEAAAKLTAQIEKNRKPEPAEIGAENWFPEELIAQSQISGSEMLKGTTYGANDFFNMPYGNGKITRIENTNYFVLELYTS